MDTYTITNTAYFKVNVTSNDSFVYRLFGEGEVECVYVQNSVENCITIKKDDLFFSCLNCGWSIEYGEEFGPYKRFKGFYLIKEEFVSEDVFVVNVDLKEESPNDPIVSFGDYVADSFKWREVNKSYTWDELLDLSKK